MYKAIIFDFDGTIADTMAQNYKAWKYALGNEGFSINEQKYYYEEGKTPKAIVSEYTDDESLIRKIAKEKEKFFLDNYEFKIYPGVIELLNKIKEDNLKIALVTGSSYERVNYILINYNIKQYFDVIITANDVTKGKPDKQPYMKALEKLNFDAKECLVIENAPMGISSAKSAGIYCVAVETTLSKENLVDADLILESIEDFLKLRIIK